MTEQRILNDSFDPDFGVLAMELLAYDPATDAMRRVTIDALNHYATCDIDQVDSATILEGLMDSDGNWQIVQTVKTGDVTSIRFATIKNNAAYTTYANAWTNRGSLTYDYYGVAF